MGESEFYNREKETREIVSYIDTDDGKNKVLLLVGKTGVGKSGLVKMILGTKLTHRLSVQVCISKSSPDTIDNLHYLNALYRTLAQLGNQRFFDEIPSPQQQGAMNIKNLLRFGMRVLWSKTAGNENQLFEPIDDGSVLRKKDYIISLLKKQHYIIDIENVQNVDSQSFEIIRDILRQVSHTTLVLEYTISETHGMEEFYSFYNELRSFNAEVLPYKIEKLDFAEAKKLAPNDIPESQLKSIYLHGDGNLVKMILANGGMDWKSDPIKFAISCLSKNEMFIVNLIYLNDGKIKNPLLYNLLLGRYPELPFSQPTIDECLFKLKLEKIIEYGADECIHIFHDSITSELDAQPANPILYTSYRVLKEFYMGQLQECPSEDTIEHLLRLFLKFSDEDVLLIFPYVKQLILSYKYREYSISKLTHFRELLTQRGTANYNTLYELSISLTELCIKLGFATEAQKNLDLVYSENNAYHRALQVAIYTLDFSNDNSMQKAEHLLDKSTSSREKFVMELSLLSGRMARMPAAESLNIIRILKDTPDYLELFEYAYLLRDYAELVSNYNESIRIYLEVLHRFWAVGRKDLCDQIFVSISMFTAYKGDLKASKKLLQEAQKNKFVPERYILNNFAVIDILEGTFGPHTVSALNDALLITEDRYEVQIIRCNLLVCYTLLNDKKNADLTYSRFKEEDYLKFKYEEFLHILYQDMYFYHLSFGNIADADNFKQKIRNLIQTLSPDSMAYRLATLQLAGTSSPDEFYSSFQFRVDFLGNWDVEISRDLEHSQ